MIGEKGKWIDVLEENTTNYGRGLIPVVAVVSAKTNRQKLFWLILISRKAEAEQWKHMIHPHFEGERVLSFSRLSIFAFLPHSDQAVPRHILYHQQMFDRLATFANKACTRGMSTQSQTDSGSDVFEFSSCARTS